MLLLVAVWLACARTEDPPGIDRDTFVAAYVDLRRATVAGRLDAAVRDSILRAHDVSEADLRAYIESRADDPAALSATWTEIRDSLAATDSAAAAADTAAEERVRPNR